MKGGMLSMGARPRQNVGCTGNEAGAQLDREIFGVRKFHEKGWRIRIFTYDSCNPVGQVFLSKLNVTDRLF
jgi:hypothetical protein